MTTHRIVCVTVAPHHGHVLELGTRRQPGSPRLSWSVSGVFKALLAGDSFYTVSPSTGARAGIEIDQCPVAGCHELTIGSTADATPDNALQNLDACKWI